MDAQLEHIATHYEYEEAVVAMADPSINGLAAPLLLPDRLWGMSESDQLAIGYVLIDGIHRAVRAYRDGVVFKARILEDYESKQCVIEADDWGIVP